MHALLARKRCLWLTELGKGYSESVCKSLGRMVRLARPRIERRWKYHHGIDDKSRSGSP